MGVGITVALSQFPKLLGIDGDPEASNVVAEVRGIVDDLGDTSWTTAALSALTLTVLLGLRRFAPAVPGPLVAVAIGIALVAFASLDEHGVALITPVPSGLPTPVGPSFDNVAGLLPGAFAIAIMCFLETASVAKAVRRSSEPPIDNDEELAANGVSCIAGAFFRAMPSAGGFSQLPAGCPSPATPKCADLRPFSSRSVGDPRVSREETAKQGSGRLDVLDHHGTGDVRPASEHRTRDACVLGVGVGDVLGEHGDRRQQPVEATLHVGDGRSERCRARQLPDQHVEARVADAAFGRVAVGRRSQREAQSIAVVVAQPLHRSQLSGAGLDHRSVGEGVEHLGAAELLGDAASIAAGRRRGSYTTTVPPVRPRTVVT